MYIRAIVKGFLLLAVPAATLFTACDPTALKGNGDILSEARDVTDFTGVDISVPGEVHVTQGAIFQVEVQAEENLLPYLKTERLGSNLHVYFSRNVRDVDGLEVRITMPSLKKVQLSGSAHLHTHHLFDGAGLTLGVSGSGKLDLDDINYDDITVNVSGSGSAIMSGAASDLNAMVSGSGEVNALDCPVETAEAHVSGSGTIRIKVSQQLNAHISGSGDIWYDGNPAIETHISGSGNIHKM